MAGTGTDEEDTYYNYDVVGNRQWLCVDINGTSAFSFDGQTTSNYELKTSYSYNQMNRLTSILQQKAGGSQLASFGYKSYANGMRRSLDEEILQSGGNRDRDITYSYDHLNRLVNEFGDNGTDDYDVDYAYDMVGNRLSRDVTVGVQTLSTCSPETEYDDADRLLKETYSTSGCAMRFGKETYYAFVGTGGSVYYKDSAGNRIGSFKAFMIGLPSNFSRYMFVLVMGLLPILLFGPGLLRLTSRYVLRRRIPIRLRVPTKGICLLVAFVMLISPESFYHLAEAEMQYANLDTDSWGQDNRTIEYTYDDNGALKTKTTKVTSPESVVETVTNQYNLRGRLDKVTTEQSNGDKRVVEYAYSDSGIRISAYSYDIPYGQSVQNEKTVVYLIDSHNHTGYAQTLEEMTFNKADPDPLTETPDSLTTYLLGDDVIAQTVNGTTQYLLYDGHGSTRQLVKWLSNDITIVDTYSYDGYGVLLQNSGDVSTPGKTDQQSTNMLYAGEHFDSDSQQYYNRARWYTPLNGRFNRVDPYAGNPQDPQSLHKYLYVHNNPINNIDPTGLFTLTQKIVTLGITTLLTGIIGGTISKKAGGSFFYGAIYGGALGFVLMQTALFQPHKLPKVVAAGFTGAILAALGARLGHWSSGTTKPWDKSDYIDPFMSGFAWSAAAEAYGSGFKSKVLVAIATSFLKDVIKLLDDILKGGLPDADGFKKFLVDTTFNALIAAATTGYTNAYVDLEALDDVGAPILKTWLVGICAIPVNTMLEMFKREIKSEIL